MAVAPTRSPILRLFYGKDLRGYLFAALGSSFFSGVFCLFLISKAGFGTAGSFFAVVAALVGSAFPCFALFKIQGTLRGMRGSLETARAVAERNAQQISADASAAAEVSERTNAAVSKISSSFGAIGEHLAQGKEWAHKSVEVSEVNSASVREGEKGLEEIRRSVLEIKAANDELGVALVRSDEALAIVIDFIDQATKRASVIHNIVFQTKLLSFNASVEAARAGEHGRGFTVVAEEIGSLARQSGKAAKEIEALLNSRKEEVKRLTHQTKASLASVSGKIHDKVAVSIGCLETSLESLRSLTARSEEIKTMVTGISMVIGSQARAAQNVTDAFSEVSTLADTQSGNCKNLAGKAHYGSQVAGTLEKLIQDLEPGKGDKAA